MFSHPGAVFWIGGVARTAARGKRSQKHHFLWVSEVTLGIFGVQFWGFSVLQRHGVSPPGGEFFPNSVSLGSSAIVKVPEQVGAAKSAGNRVPGKVPGRSFLLRENPSGQPDRHGARLGTGFPARGSQARFPGTGSQATVPSNQEEVPSKVPNKGSPSKVPKQGYQQGSQEPVPKQEVPKQVPKQGFPGKGSQAKFPSKVPRQGYQEEVPSKVPKQGSQARFPSKVPRQGYQEEVPSKVPRKRFPRFPGRGSQQGSQARFPSKGSQE